MLTDNPQRRELIGRSVGAICRLINYDKLVPSYGHTLTVLYVILRREASVDPFYSGLEAVSRLQKLKIIATDISFFIDHTLYEIVLNLGLHRFMI